VYRSSIRIIYFFEVKVKRGVTIAMEDHVDSIIADKVKDLKKHLITNNADNGALLNHYIKGKSVNDSMLLILPEKFYKKSY
jgi:hypothetical protein